MFFLSPWVWSYYFFELLLTFPPPPSKKKEQLFLGSNLQRRSTNFSKESHPDTKFHSYFIFIKQKEEDPNLIGSTLNM